jgi:pentatricopeptide repeat protein
VVRVRSTNSVQELLQEAYEMDQGCAAHIELLVKAVELADSLQDTALGYEARDELIEAAAFGGRSELIFPAFAWMLGQLDKASIPAHETWNVLWKYKWAINHMNGYPSVTAAQIEAATNDFAIRLEKVGSNPRVLHYLRWKYQVHRGDKTKALEEMKRWEQLPKSTMSDCEACEANFKAQFYAWIGDDKRALETAKPIFTGRLKCGEIPDVTYGHMLRSHLKLGLFEEAMQMHKKGYRRIQHNSEFLSQVGLHLEFLVFTKNIPNAVKLFEKHLPWALEQADLSLRFDFYEALIPLWKALLEQQQTHLKLNLPSNFKLEKSNLGYDILELQQYFLTELERIAKLFDTRNGTTAFANRITDTPDWTEAVPHIPLRVKNDKNEVL